MKKMPAFTGPAVPPPITLNVQMPTGIASVECIDPGIGDMLIIRFKNGRQVVIDCHDLSGEHEVQVGLYENFEGGGDDGHLAGMSFNGNGNVQFCRTKIVRVLETL